MANLALVDTSTWYGVEYSIVDADDWFTTGETYDSVDSARQACGELNERRTRMISSKPEGAIFEYRIVRKTITTEVL